MNCHPSDDRRMLADSLDRYVAEQYGIETRHRISQSAASYSAEQWSQFAELGIIAALFTEAQGGLGGTGFDIATVFESLGRGLVVEPFLASAVLAGSALTHVGTPTQQALVDEIMAGRLIATLAHEEAHSHHELHRVSTRATREGDHYVIYGVKAVVPFGDQAAQIIVSATSLNSAICARIAFAPSAQLSPMVNGLACRTEYQNAVGVCPDSVRPLKSVIVPEIITGSS